MHVARQTPITGPFEHLDEYSSFIITEHLLAAERDPAPRGRSVGQ
jgi:hypothetical protein